MIPLRNQPSSEFERLIEAHRPRLRAFLLSLTGSEAAAEDLAQETCLVLWRKRDEFDTGGNFQAWAFRIAFFVAQNHRRKMARQRSREIPGDELLDRIAEIATQVHARHDAEDRRRSALRHCLSKLSAPHRDLVLSRYLDGTSLADLSNAAEINRNAMAQKLFRIRKSLARCLRKHLGEAV